LPPYSNYKPKFLGTPIWCGKNEGGSPQHTLDGEMLVKISRKNGLMNFLVHIFMYINNYIYNIDDKLVKHIFTKTSHMNIYFPKLAMFFTKI